MTRWTVDFLDDDCDVLDTRIVEAESVRAVTLLLAQGDYDWPMEATQISVMLGEED